MLISSIKSPVWENKSTTGIKKMRNYIYKDHAESKKQNHFKVLWDTLQYWQGGKDSELWLQPRY